MRRINSPRPPASWGKPNILGIDTSQLAGADGAIATIVVVPAMALVGGGAGATGLFRADAQADRHIGSITMAPKSVLLRNNSSLFRPDTLPQSLSAERLLIAMSS